MENRKGVVLQGHLDMVPQKNRDKKHDFTANGIEAFIDGDWVKAKGTTLGADNGIGVSAALAVLAAKNLKHGPLEVLLTATEETGMDGANGLKPGILQGEILINTDSEDEGELYVGCAGGEDVNAVFHYTEEEVPAGYAGFKLNVTGLKGGHSESTFACSAEMQSRFFSVSCTVHRKNLVRGWLPLMAAACEMQSRAKRLALWQ